MRCALVWPSATVVLASAKFFSPLSLFCAAHTATIKNYGESFNLF
jgi:hypothetical protein